jgi:hypothetical protein
MSHDSRHMRDSTDRFAEQFSDVDAGLRIEPPKVDWARAAANRRAHRQITRSLGGAAVVLCLLLPVAWYANRPSEKATGGAPIDGPPTLAENDAEIRAAAKQELGDMDRELSRLNRQIASLKQRERSRQANLKSAALLKANPIEKVDHSDPIEEGALVMLAAAEKTAQKEGKAAGLPLYRRIVEIFPDSRSAEIARRELM